MSTTERALALFSAGVPVRDIGPLVGMELETLRRILARWGKRPQARASITYMTRVCPFHDSCRDCTFRTCALDRVKAVTL